MLITWYSCASLLLFVHACSVSHSRLTLGDPMDCSMPGSSVHGIFQARILESVAISYSRGFSRPRDRTHVSSIGTRVPGGASGREPTCQCRRHKRHRFNFWFKRSPGGGHGNLLQYSCLENAMDRGAWQATVHGEIGRASCRERV